VAGDQLVASPVARAVLRESVGFIGGGAAALLQTAHPYVAKAIYDHSDVLSDPLTRFKRTFFFIFRMTFGDFQTVLRASRSLRKIHQRISGTLGGGDRQGGNTGSYAAGEAYSAHDREALKWVYATLLETNVFLQDMLVHEVSLENKTETLRYLAEGAVLFGLTPRDFPADYDHFERYYFGVCHSPFLAVTKEGKEICDALMRPILWDRWLPVVNTLKIVTGVLLPEPIARQYGFNVGILPYIYTSLLLALVQIVYG